MDKGNSKLNSFKNNKIKENDLEFIKGKQIYSYSALKLQDLVEVRKSSSLGIKIIAKSDSVPSDPRFAPIRIVKNAEVKKECKNGFQQVKYTWTNRKFKYQVRWHTPTPNSPEKKPTWVVTRRTLGDKTNKKKLHILVGKRWVNFRTWEEAIKAYKTGTATNKQKQMLKNGHLVGKKGKKL